MGYSLGIRFLCQDEKDRNNDIHLDETMTVFRVKVEWVVSRLQRILSNDTAWLFVGSLLECDLKFGKICESRRTRHLCFLFLNRVVRLVTLLERDFDFKNRSVWSQEPQSTGDVCVTTRTDSFDSAASFDPPLHLKTSLGSAETNWFNIAHDRTASRTTTLVPESPGSKSPRSNTKCNFAQAFGGEEIEPNVYRLTKPYFETLQSLDVSDPSLIGDVESENLRWVLYTFPCPFCTFLYSFHGFSYRFTPAPVLFYLPLSFWTWLLTNYFGFFRYDYSNGILTFKTPAPQHEYPTAKILRLICSGLDKIEAQSQNPDTIKLARSIEPSGAADIEGEDCVYQPSSQFRLSCPSPAKYSGVAVQVDWSQPWRRLERILRLTLGDFVSRDTCAKSFPMAELDTEILIPLGKVYESAQRGFELWQLKKGKHQDEARV